MFALTFRAIFVDLVACLSVYIPALTFLGLQNSGFLACDTDKPI
jgi:hypothetical protein